MKCDRCGDEFELRPYLPALFPDTKVFDKITFGKSDDRSAYMIPQTLRICPTCQKSFERWIRRGRKKKRECP